MGPRPLGLREAARRQTGCQAGRGSRIVVRVETSRLTTRHPNGDWPVKPSPPFIPGHEGSASSRNSAGTDQVAVDDRVAMPWLGYACGSCESLRFGWRRHLSRRTPATRSTADSPSTSRKDRRYVVQCRTGSSWSDAAPLTCAGVTTRCCEGIKWPARARPTWPRSRRGGLGHRAPVRADRRGRVVAVDLYDETQARGEYLCRSSPSMP